MRVLQINAVLGYGSTGVIVNDIHKLSAKLGIESFVMYSTTTQEFVDEKNCIQIGNTIGKKVHAVLARVNGQQAYYSRYATKRLLRQIMQINPDIVHLHNLHSNFVNLNSLLDYLGKNNIRTIITLHDCWFYTGGCFHYTNVGCERWLEECGNCPKKLKDTPAYLKDESRKILRDRKKYFGRIRNLTVVGVSNWISDEARKTFLGERNIFTIYNGVDMSFFKPTASTFRENYNLQDKFVLLGIANKWLKPVNRELLSAILKWMKEDMKFVIIGCDKRQISSLSEKIIAIPFVKEKQKMREIYSSCDVFTNCTREDSFSLVNVEAQACGTPVVTYSNTGAKETVDNKSSFAVQTGNIEQFIKSIEMIYQNGKSTFSDSCRDVVREKFDKERNYLKYIQLYKTEMNSPIVIDI